MNFLSDMFTSWPFILILVVLLAVPILTVLSYIVYCLYIILDTLFLPKKQSTGLVVSKNFTPATEKVPYYPIDPADFSLHIKVGDKQDSISVQKELFNSVRVGNVVTAKYVFGRISGSLYIKGIECA